MAVFANWRLPRSAGLLGLLAGHVLGVLCVVVMGYVSLVSGVWETYEDGLVVVGLAFQGVLLNILLLPLSIWGMLRWRAAQA